MELHGDTAYSKCAKKVAFTAMGKIILERKATAQSLSMDREKDP